MGIKYEAFTVPASMQPLPDWMVRSDLVILDFLDGHDIEAFQNPPMAIARNVGLSASGVNERARTLTRGGLLARVEDGHGYYRLTDLGRRYLAEELSEDERAELEAFDPDNGADETDENDK